MPDSPFADPDRLERVATPDEITSDNSIAGKRAPVLPRNNPSHVDVNVSRRSITTLVIGDHPLIIEALKLLENEIGQCDEALHATDIAQGADILKTHQVDAILIETSCEDSEGLDFLTWIRALDPTISVIVLSVSASTASINGAISAGATSYITDLVPRDYLLQAISLAITGVGLILMPPQRIKAMIATDNRICPNHVRGLEDAWEKTSRLTEREKNTLGLIRKGYSNKEIAKELGILEGTVKVYVKSILRSLNAKNRTEAAMMTSAIDLNPVNTPDRPQEDNGESGDRLI